MHDRVWVGADAQRIKREGRAIEEHITWGRYVFDGETFIVRWPARHVIVARGDTGWYAWVDDPRRCEHQECDQPATTAHGQCSDHDDLLESATGDTYVVNLRQTVRGATSKEHALHIALMDILMTPHLTAHVSQRGSGATPVSAINPLRRPKLQ